MKATPDAQGRSVRLLRIGEQVRAALAEIIGRGELRDDLLERSIISVSEVRVSPDLRHATVFVKPLGTTDDDAIDVAVIRALGQHKGYLRGQVAKKLATKYTPELQFRRDESFDAGARIDAVFRRPEVARDLAPEAPPKKPLWDDEEAS